MHHTAYADHLYGHVNLDFYKFPIFNEVNTYTMSSYVTPAQIPADGASPAEIVVQLYKNGSPYGGENGSEGTEYIYLTTDKGSFYEYGDEKETTMFYSSYTGSSVSLYADTTTGNAHITISWHAHQENPIIQTHTIKMGDYFLTVDADPETLPADGTTTSQVSVSVDPYTGALGNIVTLTTDRGTFAGGSDTVDVTLDGSGQGTVTFVAPDETGFCHIHGVYGEAEDTARIQAEGKTLQLAVSPDTLPADSQIHGKVKVRLLDEWFSAINGESITLTTDLGTFENGLQTIVVTSGWDWVDVGFIPEDGNEGTAHIQASCTVGTENLSASGEIGIFSSKLIIQVNPDWLESNGEDEANAMVSLFLGGQPAGEGNIIWLSTDRGILESGESSGSTLMLETNGGGIAFATLTSSEDPGMATVLAEYLPGGLSGTALVPMTELEFDGELLSVAATGVPATTMGETQDVPREEDEQGSLPSEVTLYGSTEMNMRVILSDPYNKLQNEYRPITLTCPEKDALGSAYITLPENGTTDGSGIFEFTLSAQNLYDAGAPISSITVIATASAEDPPLTHEFSISVINNLDLLLGIYQAEIFHGIVAGGDLLRTLDEAGIDVSTQRKLIEMIQKNNNAMGHINNALESVLFDLVPGRWNDQFSPFACGGYQVQVLMLLDSLRLDATTYGQTSWLLNGLDYGPLSVSGGVHVAAMIYPRVSGQGDWAGDDTLVLDPWLTQTPQSYSWNQWHDALDAASFGITGWVVTPGSLANAHLNNYYPANGNDYPLNPQSAVSQSISDMYEGLIVDCPVYVTIEDSQGRISGYDPAGSGPDIVKDDIPELNRSNIKLDDGTSGWYFELPDNVLTVTLQGYGAGEMTITRFGDEGRFEQYRQITIGDGHTCQLLLDPNHPDLEVIVVDDGNRVLSDDSLSFGTWAFNESAATSDTQLTITNTDNVPIYGPLRITAETLEPNDVFVSNADGIDGGKWYWDCDALLTGGQLQPGESISKSVSFSGVTEPNGLDVLLVLRGYTDTAQTNQVLCTRKDFVQGLPRCGDDNHLYPAGDINRDCRVNHKDFALLADQWLNDECDQKYDCWNSDQDDSNIVDLGDLAEVASSWLICTDPDDCT